MRLKPRLSIPGERETLPDAAKRLVAKRDKALDQLANQPPPVFKEVIPPDLKGVREAAAELPFRFSVNIGASPAVKDSDSLSSLGRGSPFKAATTPARPNVLKRLVMRQG